MRYKHIVLAIAILLGFSTMAQKPKTVQFTPAGLPDELLEYLNTSTSDKDRQKENTKILKEFKSVYNNFDSRLQERIVSIYAYAVKAKMKGNPEMSGLTQMLTTIATTPTGGADVAGAYSNAPNLEGFVESMETFAKRNAKAKAATEYVAFCHGLFTECLLYHSGSSDWRFAPRTPFRLVVEKGVPLVYFDTEADLHYASAKDEGVILATRGIYNYKENLWQGQGGRLEWKRTGLAPTECYAELGRYTAETKFPKFKADSVQFVNTRYFSTPIAGHVEDQLSGPQEPEKYSYPRFRSYQRDFVIPNIMPDVDYSGSFMMNGSKFITASSKSPASLIFNQGSKGRLAVSSLKFTITPSRMMAENATVVIHLGDDDSITNTGILVRYVPADKQVVLVNDSKRNFYSPYVDSYHNLDIYSESIVWKLETDEILFSNLASGGAVSNSTFESSNYYTYRKYRDIKGIDETSPVERVYDYARSKSFEFSVKGFSDYIGLDMSQTLLMIHNLSRHGLVSYNEMTGRVRVKDKLVDYQKASSRSKGFDYDALALESVASGTNARLSLANNNLTIRGVEQFVVSDSQYVVVHPDSLTGRQVVVGRDRSLHFSGRIDVGKFMLTVKDADFSYDSFSFNMPVISRMEFYVPDFNTPDKYEQLVRTPLSNLVGTLRVDKPDNHCGMVKNKEYPIFQSLENSFVYYDAANIQGGQYTRDRFYYTLLPFTINSMVDFVTDSLQFTGVLTSGGIFPDIEEPLRVQRDYYLGFRTETPAAGFPAYGDKGHFTKKIKLDHTGLRGNGTLDYLTSTSRSKDYLFLPDSTVAVTDTFSVREEQGFPQISNSRANLHWHPYADSMAVATLAGGRPFAMYRGESRLTGRVDLKPQGATADGKADVREGSFESHRFALAAREMSASVSNFTLRSTTYNAIAFSAQNVSSSVNYDTRHADLQSTQGPVRTDLQLVRYQAMADRFSWEMDRKELSLANSTRGTSEGLDGLELRLRLPKLGDLPGVHFVSTDPARKQLSFNSLLSLYKYDLGELSSQGVFLVSVADAAIAPAADTLHVTKGGEMRVLNNAQVAFNRDSVWHTLTGADLLIASADSYSGKGYYDFHNDQEKPQRLFMNEVSTAGGVTVARGTIGDEAAFTLSSAFGFAGKVRLEGNHRWPFFEGGVRLIQPCIPADQLGLLAYADYTDPDHVHVVVPEQPTDWRGNRITASILLDRNTLRPHPAFLTNEKVYDNELLAAHGVLTYLGDRKQYMIGSTDKVSNPDEYVEPYLALSTEDCTVEGEGPVKFNLRPNQASFYAYGTANVGIQNSDDDILTTVFGFSVPLDKGIVAALAANVKDDLRLAPIGPSTNAELRHAMMYHLGADKGAAAYAVYSATGTLDKIPDAMVSTVLFDNIRWQYTPSAGLYYDGKVGIIAIGDKILNLQANLKAQITRRNNKQILTFYLQLANDHWYFFSYDLFSQELTLRSSSGTWEDLVKGIPLDQRKVEKEGLGTFRYFVGNESSQVQKWLSSFAKSVYPDGE